LCRILVGADRRIGKRCTISSLDRYQLLREWFDGVVATARFSRCGVVPLVVRAIVDSSKARSPTRCTGRWAFVVQLYTVHNSGSEHPKWWPGYGEQFGLDSVYGCGRWGLAALFYRHRRRIYVFLRRVFVSAHA